jgi:hypothetical protein
MRATDLFECAYADAHRAGDVLSLIADERMDLHRIREALKHIRAAASALTTLESILAGQPQPKQGD